MAEFVHGTAVALAGRAVLIRGRSGAGKSDLALRCLAQPQSVLVPSAVTLVADDRVAAAVSDGRIFLTAPQATRGRIEVRGVGIVTVPSIERAELKLIVDLVADAPVERHPDPLPVVDLFGVKIPLLEVHAFENSAPLKVLIALQRV
ncbi:MAG: HPr kinase/phosphorylase [Hyphomicrobiaceae bacterium]